MGMTEGRRQASECAGCQFQSKCTKSKEKIIAAFGQEPFKLSNTFGKPYKSKYFNDKRYEPPRELTAEDIYCALDELKLKGDLYL